MVTSREIRLKSRPVGVPAQDNFELASVEVGAPGGDEIQVKNLWMSVDPYMRGRMSDRKSYVPPFELGKALQGGAIGEVTASNDPDFKPGDIVSTMFGWREVFNVSPKALAAGGMGAVTKIDTHGLPPQTFLGVAGMPATPRKAWGGRPWVSIFVTAPMPLAARALGETLNTSRQPNMVETMSPGLKSGSFDVVTSPIAPPCSALPSSNGGV